MKILIHLDEKAAVTETTRCRTAGRRHSRAYSSWAEKPDPPTQMLLCGDTRQDGAWTEDRNSPEMPAHMVKQVSQDGRNGQDFRENSVNSCGDSLLNRCGLLQMNSSSARVAQKGLRPVAKVSIVCPGCGLYV
jgi:hypothetical protein